MDSSSPPQENGLTSSSHLLQDATPPAKNSNNLVFINEVPHSTPSSGLLAYKHKDFAAPNLMFVYKDFVNLPRSSNQENRSSLPYLPDEAITPCIPAAANASSSDHVKFKTKMQERRYSKLIEYYMKKKTPSLKDLALDWQINEDAIRRYIVKHILPLVKKHNIKKSIQEFLTKVADQPLGGETKISFHLEEIPNNEK